MAGAGVLRGPDCRTGADSQHDVCGERGEYHSFVFGGPLFPAPLELQEGSSLEMEGHLILDVTLKLLNH